MVVGKASSLSRMKKLGAYKPSFRFGFRLSTNKVGTYTEVLPFQKSWPAIAFISVFLAAFSIPLFTMNFSFADMDDLFDLTTNLFQLFWSLGWSIGVLFIALILIAMLFAREVIIVDQDKIILRIEVLNVGIESSNPLVCLSDLRFVSDGSIIGAKWRGSHLTFDYLNIPVSFGSNLDSEQAEKLSSKITKALQHPIPARLSAETEALVKNKQPLPNMLLHALDEEINSDSNETPQNSAHQDEIPADKKSTLFLLVANLIPLAGVILAQWDIAQIMLLFWLESGIIGFFNVLKMFRLSGPVAIFYSIFFIGHFGGFMSVHLLFIFALFIEGEGLTASLPEVLAIFQSLWLAILALFISHGFSFWQNFIHRQEYKRLSIRDQMHKPYSRIILMHVTLIFGGFLVLALNSRFLALALLIGMKIAVDIGAHAKEHRR